jgi:hypothetical protein
LLLSWLLFSVSQSDRFLTKVEYAFLVLSIQPACLSHPVVTVVKLPSATQMDCTSPTQQVTGIAFDVTEHHLSCLMILVILWPLRLLPLQFTVRDYADVSFDAK